MILNGECRKQAITLKTPVTGSVCQLEAVWSQDLRFPPHVALVPNNFLAINPDHILAPQHGVDFFPVNLLDHRDPAPENRHAVALL